MTKITLALAIFACASSALAASHPSHDRFVRHGRAGDLEMSGQEMGALYERLVGKAENPDPEAAKLQPIIDAAKKMYQWIDAINSVLPPGQKFSLTTAETQVAYPIERPRTYNVALIQEKMDEFVAKAPASMKNVILSQNPVTQSMPVTVDEFRTAGLMLDRTYALATRWLALLPEIEEYRKAKLDDVRAYYTLKNEKDLKKKLEGFAKLPKAERARLSKALIGICLNAGVSEKSCAFQLELAKLRRQVGGFYGEFASAAKETWDEFFAIPADAARKDVTWTFSDPYVMTVPFIDPQDPVVLDYLTVNIEDEFSHGPWHLRLKFLATGDPEETIHIKQVPGTVPHVNGIGGSEITMDANAPLSEYNVQWTIRHEYGHTLAFPDCYIEFFDDDVQAFVSYQLDITNLMCSRRGHLKPEHFEELKRVYLKLP